MSKFAFALLLVGTLNAIFINKVLYFTITCQVGDNIKIQRVFTFFKILAPLGSINFASFVNLKCFFKALGKVVVQVLKQTLKSANHLQM